MQDESEGRELHPDRFGSEFGPTPPGSPSRRSDRVIGREAGLAMSIPTLMVSGPIVGLAFGWILVRVFAPVPPWNRVLMVAGLLLGAVSGLRESYKVLKKIGAAGATPPPTKKREGAKEDRT